MTNEDWVAAHAADEAYGQDEQKYGFYGPDQGRDLEVIDAELEAAAHRHFQATSDWHKVCQQLDLQHDKVTLEQLIDATLSSDPGVQVARLGSLFRSCGLTGAWQASERTDLVNVIADHAPQNERERQIIYQSAISQSLAMICAEEAAGPAQTPQVRALLSGSFQQLSSHGLALDEKLDALRGGGGVAPRDVIGHLHVHTTAAVSSRSFYVRDSLPPLAPDTPSIRGEWCDAVDGADNADASGNQADGDAEGAGCQDDAP